MYRATTPTHQFILPVDTSELKEIQITYKQGNRSIVKHYQDGVLPSGMTLDGVNVYVRLTQGETLTFQPGKSVKAQVRVLTETNDAMASQKFDIKLNNVLNEDVLV